MKWAVVAVIALHGLIHLMGPAKAFGWAELPQLTEPISRAGGVVWLVTALALLATAVAFALSLPYWWVLGFAAMVGSQAVIVASWGDAKFGTIPNLILLAVVVWGFMSEGPPSFRAEYRSAVASRLADVPRMSPLTESDLAPLPEPVRRYLRVTGAVGAPRAHHVRVAWTGRIRAGPDEPWMEFTAEQWNFPHEPARFFRMDARRSGLPVDVLHAFRHGEASMRVRLLSMIPLLNAAGPETTRAETVTLLNDMALLMPSALADPEIRWEAIDERSARATYRVGAHEIGAVLHFDDAGELVNFVSDDRLAASPDGTEFTPLRWSTPIGGYRDLGARYLMTRGEGRWHAPEGEYVYIEMELVEFEVNGGG